MTKNQKMLQQLATAISAYLKNVEIRVNRRNGYYALDEYRDDRYKGYLICGNYKECYHYLAGMRDAILMKMCGDLPF